MSARTLLMWGGLALLLGACGDEASAGKATSGTDSTPASATPTSHSVVLSTSSASTSPPQAAIPDGLLEDCVAFVEYSAAQGEPFMSMLWNSAGGDTAKVFAECEAQWYITDDTDSDGVPDGQENLADWSQKKK